MNGCTVGKYLESYEKRIAELPGREPARARRQVRTLIERLYAVKWR